MPRTGQSWYDRPLPPARSAVLAWVAAVAVLADLAFRLPPGSLAAALLVLGLVGLIASCGRLHSVTEKLGAGLLVALSAAFVLRTSAWVVTIAASAVLALAVLLAADGLRTDQGPTWLRSVGASLRSMILVPRWARISVERLPRLGPGRAGPLIRAAVVGGLVLLVLGSLLASGDAVFGAYLSSLSPGPAVSHLAVIAVFAFPAAGLALLGLRDDRIQEDALDDAACSDPVDDPADDLAPDPVRMAGSAARFRVESLAARWSVAGLLTLWCVVQLVVVSGGAKAVLADEGLTAAQYARQGFFQLVTVAAVSLTVLNVTQRLLAPGPARSGSRWRGVPVLVIGGALGVLIAVTFSRLAYYMDAFGLTMLRLAVATFLGWLGLMTALSVARALGLGAGRCWLQTATVLSAAAAAVLYAAVNPAAVVASVNLERAESLDQLDVDYLLKLGPDTRSVVADFDWDRLGGRPARVEEWLCRPPADAGYGLLGWNLARAADQPDPAC